MPTFPGGQITSVSPTVLVRENQIFSGSTRNSHFSEKILLAGNHSHFFFRGGGKTTIRAGGKTTIKSIFLKSDFRWGGGEGGKTSISVGEIQLTEVFPTPGIPIFSKEKF